VKTLLVLIVLLGLGIGAYWYLTNTRPPEQVRRVGDQAAQSAEKVKNAVQDKLKDWSLSAPDIRQEMERTGKVVRKKAQEVGAAIADATVDARTTATIKTKLAKDSGLSALRISVNTTAGVVTLSGSVASADDVSQAMKLALDTEGVREVVSTLQVKPGK
jgi:hyperosmotically inducible periplasmic protein